MLGPNELRDVDLFEENKKVTGVKYLLIYIYVKKRKLDLNIVMKHDKLKLKFIKNNLATILSTIDS